MPTRYYILAGPPVYTHYTYTRYNYTKCNKFILFVRKRYYNNRVTRNYERPRAIKNCHYKPFDWIISSINARRYLLVNACIHIGIHLQGVSYIIIASFCHFSVFIFQKKSIIISVRILTNILVDINVAQRKLSVA